MMIRHFGKYKTEQIVRDMGEGREKEREEIFFFLGGLVRDRRQWWKREFEKSDQRYEYNHPLKRTTVSDFLYLV